MKGYQKIVQPMEIQTSSEWDDHKVHVNIGEVCGIQKQRWRHSLTFAVKGRNLRIQRSSNMFQKGERH